MKESLKELEYREKYGFLPSTREELLFHLEKNLKLDMNKINQEEERILSIPWNRIHIEAFLVPHGSPRPRLGGGHFYVKGAAETKRYFKKIINDNKLICTRVQYFLTLYMPTPVSSMTNTEIYLAEKGVILPTSTSDWDNLAKTYTDCLQGILLLNDNQINPGGVIKYYSIKPRVEIDILYQNEFDCRYNEKKVRNSKGFKAVEDLGKEYTNGVFIL